MEIAIFGLGNASKFAGSPYSFQSADQSIDTPKLLNCANPSKNPNKSDFPGRSKETTFASFLRRMDRALAKAHLGKLNDIGNAAHFWCEFDKYMRVTRSPTELRLWGAVRYTLMRKPEERKGLAVLR